MLYDTVVKYPAKVRILKQITTHSRCPPAYRGCKIPCKGKNFKANHNYSTAEPNLHEVVKYPAKVRILKQITTVNVLYLCSREL